MTRTTRAQRGGVGLGILQRAVRLHFPKALGSGFWSYLQIRKQKLRDATNLNSSRKSLDFNTSLSGWGGAAFSVLVTVPKMKKH